MTLFLFLPISTFLAFSLPCYLITPSLRFWSMVHIGDLLSPGPLVTNYNQTRSPYAWVCVCACTCVDYRAFHKYDATLIRASSHKAMPFEGPFEDISSRKVSFPLFFCCWSSRILLSHESPISDIPSWCREFLYFYFFISQSVARRRIFSIPAAFARPQYTL